jgi:hypothetical protein
LSNPCITLPLIVLLLCPAPIMITSFQNTVNRIAEKINPNNPPTVAQLQAKGGEIVEFFQGLPPYTHRTLDRRKPIRQAPHSELPHP